MHLNLQDKKINQRFLHSISYQIFAKTALDPYSTYCDYNLMLNFIFILNNHLYKYIFFALSCLFVILKANNHLIKL